MGFELATPNKLESYLQNCFLAMLIVVAVGSVDDYTVMVQTTPVEIPTARQQREKRKSFLTVLFFDLLETLCKLLHRFQQ